MKIYYWKEQEKNRQKGKNVRKTQESIIIIEEQKKEKVLKKLELFRQYKNE